MPDLTPESRSHILADLEQAYHMLQLDPLVSSLNREDPVANETYLGAGFDFSAVRIDASSGPLVVRIPHEADPGEYDPQDAFDRRIESLIRGVGAKSLEQIVAIKPDELLVVSELLPGTLLSRATATDISAITAEHLRAVIDTAHTVIDRGVEFDSDSHNITLASDGFHFLDYHIPFSFRPQSPPPRAQYRDFCSLLGDLGRQHRGENAWSDLVTRAQAIGESYNWT